MAEHEIVILKPKPAAAQISSMIAAYFDSEASGYDQFTEQIERRRLFCAAVDKIIASALASAASKGQVFENILSIGAGTGRREIDIRSACDLQFSILGTDVSSEMCGLMKERGLEAICGAWEKMAIESLPKKQFDAVFILHTFGLLPSGDERLSALKKVSEVLRPGGLLFVDVLNLDDIDEWGAEIKKVYFQHSLAEAGYECGDVVYKRIDGDVHSFCHYFNRDEMTALLTRSGLAVERIINVGYAAQSGEIFERADRGSMLFIVGK